MAKAQKLVILDFIKEHGSITQMEAVYLGCYRLSARIFELRQMGVDIISDIVKVQTRDGGFAWVARYRINDGVA